MTMNAWTVHTAHAYDSPDPDQLESIGEALSEYDAAVSAAAGAVHVDLTLEATGPLQAAEAALAAVAAAGLRDYPVTQVEIIDEAEAERRMHTPSLHGADGRPVRVLPSDDELPTLSSLVGSMPHLTEGASSEEYLAKNRRELGLGG